jgi:hypothetical protein
MNPWVPALRYAAAGMTERYTIEFSSNIGACN